MRTTPIITIIKRYGLTSKRLNPKNRIKYEDAINGLKGYENSELKIADVIDNVRFPHKSISCNCQIPGCNHKIRYEYVLEDKKTKEQLVAGSTCVWPTLGLSELQKKDFLKFEKAVKEYHDMLAWKDENPDVVEKLALLEKEGFTYYRPFWNEIQHCRLTDMDTDYIRNTDVNKMIQQREERKQREEAIRKEREERERQYRESYNKVLKGLESLTQAYPENAFYSSLARRVDLGVRLSDSQQRYIKIGCNKLWYETNVKGKAIDCWDTVEDILKDTLSNMNYLFPSEAEVARINKEMETEERQIRFAWTVYKVKHELVAY
jgi:hypothetical protein